MTCARCHHVFTWRDPLPNPYSTEFRRIHGPSKIPRRAADSFDPADLADFEKIDRAVEPQTKHFERRLLCAEIETNLRTRLIKALYLVNRYRSTADYDFSVHDVDDPNTDLRRKFMLKEITEAQLKQKLYARQKDLWRIMALRPIIQAFVDLSTELVHDLPMTDEGATAVLGEMTKISNFCKTSMESACKLHECRGIWDPFPEIL